MSVFERQGSGAVRVADPASAAAPAEARLRAQRREAQLPSLEWLIPILDEAPYWASFDGRVAGHAPVGAARDLLVVRVDEQRLYVIRDGVVDRILPVSTAERGIGQIEGSLQTPLGWHRVERRIGEGEPRGMIFRARVPTGRIAEILTEPGARSPDDNITTRILWLSGLEDGFNRGRDARGRVVDSFQRYIYFHGTDEEGRIGQPASDGCIRLFNDDVLWLFDRTPEGALALILEGSLPVRGGAGARYPR